MEAVTAAHSYAEICEEFSISITSERVTLVAVKEYPWRGLKYQ